MEKRWWIVVVLVLGILGYYFIFTAEVPSFNPATQKTKQDPINPIPFVSIAPPSSLSFTGITSGCKLIEEPITFGGYPVNEIEYKNVVKYCLCECVESLGVDEKGIGIMVPPRIAGYEGRRHTGIFTQKDCDLRNGRACSCFSEEGGKGYDCY